MKRRRKMIRRATLVVTLSALTAGRAAPQASAKAPPTPQSERARTQTTLGTSIARAAAGAARSSGPQAVQAPRFEVDMLWPKPMPKNWLLGSAVGIAIDSKDHVFVINLTNSFTARTETGADANPPIGECCFPAPAVLEFDPAGTLVNSWGGPGPGYDWPITPTGISLDAKENVWIAGSGGLDAHILEFTRDGKFLKQIGKPGVAPAPPPRAGNDTAYAGVSPGGRGGRGGGRGRGGAPAPSLPPNSGSTDAFGGATQIAFEGNEAFVADGLRNRRVAVVDLASGAITRFWGAYGKKPDDAALAPYDPSVAPPQQFSTVKCAKFSRDGMLYVCDRGNDRIQVFKKDGSFVLEKRVAFQTRGEGSVWDIAFSRDPQQRYVYVADGANDKVRILDRMSLEELASFGEGGRQPGEFYAVHSIAVDSKGNVYTVETYEGKRLQKFVYKGVGPLTKANMGVVWPAAGGKKP